MALWFLSCPINFEYLICCINSKVAFDFEMTRIHFVLCDPNLTVDIKLLHLTESEGLQSMDCCKLISHWTMSVPMKAGTERTLGLCWQQSHCSNAERREPFHRQQQLYMSCLLFGHRVLPWDTNLLLSSLPSTRHKRKLHNRQSRG